MSVQALGAPDRILTTGHLQSNIWCVARAASAPSTSVIYLPPFLFLNISNAPGSYHKAIIPSVTSGRIATAVL